MRVGNEIDGYYVNTRAFCVRDNDDVAEHCV